MKTGRALRAIRVFYELSRSESARKLGLTKSFLADLEHNRKSPSIETLQRYSDVFDIPVSSIILLAENENERVNTFKARVRAALRKRILAMLELMADESLDVDKPSM